MLSVQKRNPSNLCAAPHSADSRSAMTADSDQRALNNWGMGREEELVVPEAQGAAELWVVGLMAFCFLWQGNEGEMRLMGGVAIVQVSHLPS